MKIRRCGWGLRLQLPPCAACLQGQATRCLCWFKCVQVGGRTRKDRFIIFSWWDPEPQICHWSISNMPPPAWLQLITSFTTQKAPSFMCWEGGMKPEPWAVMSRGLLIFSSQIFIHSISTDGGSAASADTGCRKYLMTKMIQRSQVWFFFLSNTPYFHTVLTLSKSPALSALKKNNILHMYTCQRLPDWTNTSSLRWLHQMKHFWLILMCLAPEKSLRANWEFN